MSDINQSFATDSTNVETIEYWSTWVRPTHTWGDPVPEAALVHYTINFDRDSASRFDKYRQFAEHAGVVPSDDEFPISVEVCGPTPEAVLEAVTALHNQTRVAAV